MRASKVKRLQISPELLFELFTAGPHLGGYSVVEDAVPADAKLINVRHGWPNQIELLIESEEFPEIEDGEKIPLFRPLVQR